jgi:hypothetical protein
MVDPNKISASLQSLMLAVHSGRPEVFRSTLIKVLRSGPLDASAAAWLADQFEKGSDDLKAIESQRRKTGNPNPQIGFD